MRKIMHRVLRLPNKHISIIHYNFFSSCSFTAIKTVPDYNYYDMPIYQPALSF